MPIYEFHCAGCRKRVEVFRRSVSSTAPIVCPNCGAGDLERLVSRFAVHRSGEFYGSDGEEQYLDGLESGDPRAMAAWARRMSRESGEPMDPEFEQMVSEMEAGHLPDDDGDFDGGDGDFDDLDS
jgi:putative FmdB family regulatory protein